MMQNSVLKNSVLKNRKVRWACGLAVLLPISFATGCGKVPTWNELTQQQAPQPAPVVVAPPPVQPTVVPAPPPKPNAAVVLATFRSLKSHEISDAAIAELSTLTEGLETATEINASGSSITGAGLANLSKLPALSSLDLSSTSVSNDVMQHLTQVPMLASLSLNGTSISDDGLTVLNACPNLKKLEIKGCKLTPNGFAAIGKMPVLEELNFEVTPGLNDVTLDLICEARTLRRLNFRDCGGITDSGMAALAKLEVLEELNINRSGVTSEGFLAVTKGGGLKNMKLLGVSVTPMTEKGARAINTMKSLEHIDLQMVAGINDLGFTLIVSGMKNLKHININDCGSITGPKAFTALKACDDLEVLHASRSGINDVSLGQLVGHKKLRKLDVFDTKCTQAGVIKLRKLLPECEIRF